MEQGFIDLFLSLSYILKISHFRNPAEFFLRYLFYCKFFRSAVMAVSWHPDEISKLMVAEKSGILHMFNIVSYHPILSLDCGTGPLLSADWSLYNSLLIATSIR